MFIKLLNIILSSTFIITFVFSYSAQAETLGGIKSTVIIASGTAGGPTLLSNDFYGSSGNTIGDLDADGVVDIIIGAYGDDTGGNRKGAAYISYLNTDGSIKSTVKLTGATVNGATLAVDDFYGYASSGIGDLDNDGIPDIAIGVKNDDTGGPNRGAVYIHYMNRDGSIKSTVKLTGATTNGAVLADLDTYGYSVFGPGDLDNDGIPDLISGAGADDTGGSNRGATYIHYMNRDGSIKSTVKIASGTLNGPVLADGACYGVGVSSIGDLDADGVIDLAVGANCDDTGGTDRGAIFIHLMNVNGSIKSTVKIASGTLNGPTLSDSDFYGIAIAKLGDIDGDDIPDIGVASYFDDSSGANLGAFYIHYLNRDASIKSTVRINSATPNGASNLTAGPTGTRYSNALFSLGDLNSDGAVDIGVGASTDSITVPVGNQHGRTFIHFMQPVIGSRVTKTSVSITEGGTSDTFDISLKSKPSSDVTVSLTGSQITTSPNNLTFTSLNWNTPQAVSVSAVDDSLVEGNYSGTLLLTNTSSDGDYNGLSNSLSVSITDNDYNGAAMIVVPIIPKSINSQNGNTLGFTINNNIPSTTNKKITLNMNADPSTVRGYVVSIKPDFSDSIGIKPYTQKDQYILPEKFGNYVVYLKYYSTNGFFSDTFSRKIKYQAPVKVTKKVVKKVIKNTKR
jgi:hypothetical protein